MILNVEPMDGASITWTEEGGLIFSGWRVNSTDGGLVSDITDVVQAILDHCKVMAREPRRGLMLPGDLGMP